MLTKYNQFPDQYETERQHNALVNSFYTDSFLFKYPYTLANYRRGINPVCALYEELQASLYRQDKTKFDDWLIDLCTKHKDDIIAALVYDCAAINRFLLENSTKKPLLQGLLAKFKSYLTFFNQF